MALTIVKKPVPQVMVAPVVEPILPVQKVLVQTPEPSVVEALTSEYLDLHKKFVYFEVKDMVKRMEEIRKSLHSIANETMDETKPALFVCDEGELEFSERQKQATVPDPLTLIAVLLAKFGPEVTASVVDIAITPLRKVLSDYELKEHLIEIPGSRTLRSIRPATS